MKIVIENSTKNFESYRAQRVKSLFNAEDGSSFKTEANIDIEDMDWGIGLIVMGTRIAKYGARID